MRQKAVPESSGIPPYSSIFMQIGAKAALLRGEPAHHLKDITQPAFDCGNISGIEQVRAPPTIVELSAKNQDDPVIFESLPIRQQSPKFSGVARVEEKQIATAQWGVNRWRKGRTLGEDLHSGQTGDTLQLLKAFPGTATK
jgi:hypothetical protein